MIRDLEAEMAVIGCAIFEIEACEEAIQRLTPAHFTEPAHAEIWQIVKEAAGSGGVADPAYLDRKVINREPYEQLGGIGYLVDLFDRAYLPSLTGSVEALLDATTRRSLQEVALTISGRCREDRAATGESLLGDLERAVVEIARDATSKPTAVPAGLTALDMLEAAWSGEYAGVSVGLDTLDHVTGGIRQDDVWIVGGRSSMGKSVFGLNLVRGLADQGLGVMVFSLEMPLREVQARLIADIAYDRSIPRNGMQGGNARYGDLLKGRGGDDVRQRARAAARRLATLPIAVNDRGGLTIDEIRIQAQRQMRDWEKAGVRRGAVLIDHIGLVRAHTKRGDSKAAETADIVNELKDVAKQLRAPVIALCQVNRGPESRNDKRPTMADLNWSGAIEQIADFVCLLYRDSYYKERSGNQDDLAEAWRLQNELELLIQKNRSGPICALKAYIDIACNAIRDRDDAEHGSAALG